MKNVVLLWAYIFLVYAINLFNLSMQNYIVTSNNLLTSKTLFYVSFKHIFFTGTEKV